MRPLVLLLMVFGVVFANEYRLSQEVALKKDVLKRILIKSEKSARVLEFRWTLYSDETLVVLGSFDDLVFQKMLRQNYVNQSFRIVLLPKKGHQIRRPYLLVKFVDFDFTKDEAKFQIFLRDEEEEIVLEYLKVG